MSLVLLLAVLGYGAYRMWKWSGRSKALREVQETYHQALKLQFPAEDIISYAGKHALMRYSDAVVQDVQTWTQTHVIGRSSGGGGYLHEGSGHISAPTMSFSAVGVTTMRVFVQDETGAQWHLDAGQSFAARPGDRVRVYFIQGANSNELVRVENSTSNSRYSWKIDVPIIEDARYQSFTSYQIVFWPILAIFVYNWFKPSWLTNDGSIVAIPFFACLLTILLTAAFYYGHKRRNARVEKSIADQIAGFVARHPSPRAVSAGAHA